MNSWFTNWKSDPSARLRLFCFPYAGGGASVYRDWADILPSNVDVCPVQPPGREGRRREAPFTRLLPLVGEISENILPLLDRPFAFFGHSLGAKVAFELARVLQKRHGLNPVCLFISACPAPQLPRNGMMHNLPEDKFIELLRSMNGALKNIIEHPRALKMVLPCIRADFEVYDTYTYLPGPLLHCPITALGGDRDSIVGLEELCRWRELTTSSFKSRLLKGDHLFLRSAQPEILEIVSNELRSALQAQALGAPSTKLFG